MTEAITEVEKFKSLSPAEFFYRNRELAGFTNPARALYQATRELIENALDATDAHGILPEIKVYIDRDPERSIFYKISVQDNGIGIPPQYVPQAFGQVLFSSKYVLRQTRGMFGLGAKMVVLYSQITTGKPVEVYTSPIGSSRIYAFRILIDVKENKPIVLYRASWRKESDWHGTVVRVVIEGDWGRAKAKVIDYVRRTAIIAPYAEIYFRDPDGNYYYYKRATTQMPRPPKETLPHPHGIDLETLKIMIKSSNTETLLDFLAKEFQGVGKVTAERFLKTLGLPLDKNPRTLSQEEVENLARALKTYNGFRPPRADHLSPIGSDIIKVGLYSILQPEFVEAVTRKPAVYEGHPFIVEIGIGYGGKVPPSDQPILLRFANKIPLLYDEKSGVSWKVISENIDWSHYEVSFPAQLVILVHICGTKIPYRGVGKESIADVPIIEKEIENGIRNVARKLKRFIIQKRKQEEMQRKAITLIKYIPEIARSLVVLGRNEDNENQQIDEEKIKEALFNLVRSKVSGVHVRKVNEVVISIE